MADEERNDQVNVGEPAFSLPIQGTEGLDFSDQGEEEQEPKPEPGKEAVGEKAEEEIVSLEQLAEKFPHLKVKLNVSGAEVVENLADAVRNRQKYAGLERNIDREKQEMRRLVGELKDKISGIEQRETRTKEPAKEPDLDDPAEFVKHNAMEAVKPELDRIEQLLQSVVQAVEPSIGEGNVKKARAIIRANGGDVAEFDAYKDSLMSQISEEAGRPISEADLKTVTPQTWAWKFATYKMQSAKPAGEPPNSGEVAAPEGEPKKIVLAPRAKGGGNSGGGGYGNRNTSTRSALLKKAQETGDWAPALGHFIRPGG